MLLQAGQVSFGHAMFFAVGAYAAAFWGKYLGTGDLVLYLVLGSLLATLSGLVVGLFVVRYREIFFGMLNLAFSMVLWSLLEKMFHYTNGADGIRVPRPTVLGMTFSPDAFQYVILYASLALAVLAFALVQRYLDSPLGHMLRAIKLNETRLEYLGTSARRVLLAGYVLSAFLGGVGGVLVAVIQGIATPEFGFWTKSGEFVFIAILGGVGHALGAFAGAAVFEIVRYFAAAKLANAWQLILGVVLIVIILFAPNGLIGLVSRKRKREGDQLMADVLLSARGISIRFGGVVAADNVDLDVLDGESLAIIGPNGAGKTTFLNISTGYLRPQAGVVTFLGKEITAQPPRTHHAARHRAGFPDPAAVPRPDGDGKHADRSRLSRPALDAAHGDVCHAGARGDGAAARSRRSEGVRRAAGARTPRGSAQARRHRAGAGLEAEASPDGRADVWCRIVGKARHHGHPHRGAGAGEGDQRFRRARHGYGRALREPGRGLELGKDPEARAAG